jgi:hypothetical protein
VPGGNPLFEVFVRIRQEGLDDINKEWEKQEEKLTKAAKDWDNFVEKKFPKQARKIKKEIAGIGVAFGKITEDQKKATDGNEKFVKSVEDGSKKSVAALGTVADAISKIQTSLEKANETGLNIEAKLTGAEEIQGQIDKLLNSGGEINLKVNLENGVESLEILRQIQDVRDDLNANGIDMPISLQGYEQWVSDTDQMRATRDDLNQTPIAPQVDTSGVESLNTSLGESRDTATDVAAGIGGEGSIGGGGRTRGNNQSIVGALRTMDADAKAARALPTLLGDSFHQLAQFRSIMAIVAATVIPGMIAGMAALGSAVAVAAAGVGGLATGLGIGLAGAAAQAGSAVILARGAITGASMAANAAISNVLGLGKGFGSLQNEAKFATTQVKAFEDLVAAMPAGTDAATHAQERLSQAIFYQQSVVREQIRWWNEYGAAAVELGGNFQQLRFDLFQIVSDTSGQLIPVLNEFVEIALTHVPEVADTFSEITRAVQDGARILTHYLNTAQGFEAVQSIIKGVGDAARPTFQIIADGLIAATQLFQPMITSGVQLLTNLREQTAELRRWTTSAEGIQQINDAWALATEYSDKLLTSVKNLGVAIGNLGQAFIQSGLTDQMLNGFVNMTQAIRDFTASAQDADSEFSQFLTDAQPILTAAGEAAAEIVRQILRVVGAVTSMRNETTGALVMVEIFNAISDAAEPLGNLLIDAFEKLGPIIADLIPDIAQLMELFLTATPELRILLSALNGLLEAFNALPDSVQIFIARVTALSLVFGPLLTSLGSAILGFVQFRVLIVAVALATGQATTTVGLLAVAFPRLAAAIVAVRAASLAALASIGLLGGALIALAAAAVVYIYVYFDREAATTAYNEAIANGETVGGAYGDAFLAGLKGVPIVGAVVGWLDENVFKPIDNLVTKLEPGGEYDGILGDWLSSQMEGLGDAYESIDQELERIGEELVSGIVEDWETIDSELERVNGEIDSTVRTVWDGLVYYLGPIVEGLVADLTVAWEGLQTELDRVNTEIDTELAKDWEAIKSAASTAWGLIVTAITTVWEPLNTELDRINTEIDKELAKDWEAIKSAASTAWGLVVTAITTVWEPLRNELDRINTQIDADLKEDWETIKSAADTAWTTTGERMTAAMQTASSVIRSIVSSLTSFVLAQFATMMDRAAALANSLGATNTAQGLRTSSARLQGSSNAQGEPTGYAKGGIQVQGSTGGISDGENARVVYGEQARATPESYIVWDRPDNEPLLKPTAAAFGGAYLTADELDSLGIQGMARGGVRRGGGRGHRRGGGGGGGGSASIIGRTYADVASSFGPSKKRQKGQKKRQKRLKKREHRLDARRTARGGRRGESGFSSEPSSGSGSEEETEETEETASGSSGESGETTEATSPSTQAYPSGCGSLYPVSSPTDPATQANTDAALADSGLAAIPAGQTVDHVNAPPGSTGDGSGCGLGGSGSAPSTPWDSIGMLPTGETTTPTTGYQPCGPSFAMAEGGTIPSGGGSGASAEPLISAETPTGQWSQFLGFSWLGDPHLDWPEITPPAGWDASTAWGDPMAAPNGSTEGYARGGINRNGVRHFQAGGLNAGQIQAGLDAGNSVLGVPYLYEWADPSMGFDCSGLMQWIYEAIAYGAPTPGPRYIGTYAWAEGQSGMTAGVTEGGFNVYTDLTGHVGDGTHSGGDVMGTPFESIGGSGVGNSNSAAGNDGIWSMGGGEEYAAQLPASPSYDPSGNLTSEVADWWTCQTAPYTETASPSYPVNPWDSQLPGMTQDYLTQVGQGTIGSLGSGGSTQPLGQTPRDWIVAALNASGMDASEENISTLETLMSAESSGDTGATSPDGAMGLMQLMPDTWAKFGQGGDPYDPVANIVASIAYQMATYGGLVSFSPYAKGGFALQPHMGMVAEGGSREAMVPFDNGPVMSQFRHAIGTEGMSEGMDVIAAKLDRLTQRVDYQTNVIPQRTGQAVALGTEHRLATNEQTNLAVSKGRELAAMRDYNAGRDS